MAFRAEMLRRRWYRVCGTNMIIWYSRKLCADWYDSLTAGQKYELELQRRREEAIARYEARTALAQLGVMSALLSDRQR